MSNNEHAANIEEIIKLAVSQDGGKTWTMTDSAVVAMQNALDALGQQLAEADARNAQEAR